MKISEVLKTLMAENVFRRTPIGRPLTEFAIDGVLSTIEDSNNYNQDAIKCMNCGIIISSLIVPSGCINCGSKDLTTELNKNDII